MLSAIIKYRNKFIFVEPACGELAIAVTLSVPFVPACVQASVLASVWTEPCWAVTLGVKKYVCFRFPDLPYFLPRPLAFLLP